MGSKNRISGFVSTLGSKPIDFNQILTRLKVNLDRLDHFLGGYLILGGGTPILGGGYLIWGGGTPIFWGGGSKLQFKKRPVLVQN